MVKYCAFCRELHEENSLCQQYKNELKKHPAWLNEMTEFATAASESYLIRSQALDNVAKVINKTYGTHFSFEGTNQLSRDVAVFKKLNEDAFAKSGVFANAKSAKAWLEAHPDSINLKMRLIGAGQEVDWQRYEQGRRLFRKPVLLNGNFPGYDGIVENRLTGKVYEQVTVKAAATPGGINTNILGIIESLEKGRIDPSAKVFGIKGTEKELIRQLTKRINDPNYKGNKELLEKMLLNIRQSHTVTEYGTNESILGSMKRLFQKVNDEQANPYITPEQAGKMIGKGAIIGFAIELSISSVKNFIAYKQGKISFKDAFAEIGEDSIKGVLNGASATAISMGPIGWVAGIAISMIIRPTVQNTLDEVFGKGAYREILDACGYTAASAQNSVELLEEIANQSTEFYKNNEQSKQYLESARTVTEETSMLLSNMDHLNKAIPPNPKEVSMTMTTKIELSHYANKNPEEAFSILKEAANDVFSESQSNFELMKNKHWYKRLFELLVFSKNNEKIIARTVASLAKLQEIVMKAMLLLYIQNRELSDRINEISENHYEFTKQINLLAKDHINLYILLNELKYGGQRELLISELDNYKKRIVQGIYTKYVINNSYRATKEGKDFTSALAKSFGTNTPEEIDYNYLDKLEPEEHKLLYKLVMSWIYICIGTYDDDSINSQELFDHFEISIRNKEIIQNRISGAIKTQGVENYIRWYSAQEDVFESGFNSINESEIEFLSDENIIESYIDFDDASIRSIVEQYEFCFGDKKVDINDPKNREEIQNCIKKTNYPIAEESIVGIYKGAYKIIITTHAMYVDNMRFVFNMLNEDNISITPTLYKGKNTLSLPDVNGDTKSLEPKIEVNALKELLLSLSVLKTAKTDEAMLFDMLPYNLRAKFYSLMLFIVIDSELSVFDTYAKIISIEQEQEENRFFDFISHEILIPTNKEEFKNAVYDFFNQIPYPSQHIISEWAIKTMLEILSLSKWSNTITPKEENLIFSMDFVGIKETDRKQELIEGTTLTPFFIDKKLSKEQSAYYFNHSLILKNPLSSVLAAAFTSGVSLLIQRGKADNMRKNLIHILLDKYQAIYTLFNTYSPVGINKNEQEKLLERINKLIDIG